MKIQKIVCRHCHYYEGSPITDDEDSYGKFLVLCEVIVTAITCRIRCGLVKKVDKYSNCTIEKNYQYTREVPEDCPKRFEHYVAAGMKHA